MTWDRPTRPDGTTDSTAPSDNGQEGEHFIVPVDTTAADETGIADRSSSTGAVTAMPPAEGLEQATAIFLDASAIVALVDRDDASHAAAVDAYRNLVRAGYKLFTTNYVVAETFDLLRTGVGPLVARQFLRDSKLAVYHVDEQDERRARRLVLDARAGGNLTLFDAISLVVMERLGVADAFAVDPSFLANES